MRALWVDDERKAPRGFDFVARSYEAAIAVLDSDEPFDAISLDNDLGTAELGKDGQGILEYIIEKNAWPAEALYIHTANSVAAFNMLAACKAEAPEHVKVIRLNAKDFSYDD